jgi:hypothetical protein
MERSEMQTIRSMKKQLQGATDIPNVGRKLPSKKF